MQKFKYPESDLDRYRALLQVLGTFWSVTYTAKDQLRAFTQAIATGVKQNADNITEAAEALSRHDIQILHTENWLPITIKRSELNQTNFNEYKFDEDALAFNGQPAISFDQLRQTNLYAARVDKELVEVNSIYDKILLPSFSLIVGIDFVIDRVNSVLLFTQNPFDLPGVVPTGEYRDGGITEESITLWGFKAKLDYNRLFTQFAYAVNMRLKSSENAKKFLNAIFDGLVAAGASASVLESALSAICDIPIVENDGEVVETIAQDNRGLFIATDKQVYRFADTVAPLVAVGDRLKAGDKLSNAFEVVSLNAGQLPVHVTALALDSGFTSACYYSDLIFENIDVPLEVVEDHPSGFTYVKFRVGGFPPDVQKFFDEMHARGIESLDGDPAPECVPPRQLGGTLAHKLDLRKTPIGEPTADDLPETINPLKFIVENVLKNNTTLVIIRVSELGKNHLGLYNIRHIRQLLPPHTALIFNYLVAGRADQIDPTESVNDTLDRFTGAEPLTDTIPENFVVDRGVTVRVISGSCQ
jgi:hypothetical protein